MFVKQEDVGYFYAVLNWTLQATLNDKISNQEALLVINLLVKRLEIDRLVYLTSKAVYYKRDSTVTSERETVINYYY